MSSSDEQKPQYFANGDFEKAVADIILTPRRSRLNYEQNESLFQFTDKQRDYYTKCFRYLLKTTQVIKDRSVAGSASSSCRNPPVWVGLWTGPTRESSSSFREVDSTTRLFRSKKTKVEPGNERLYSEFGRCPMWTKTAGWIWMSSPSQCTWLCSKSRCVHPILFKNQIIGNTYSGGSSDSRMSTRLGPSSHHAQPNWSRPKQSLGSPTAHRYQYTYFVLKPPGSSNISDSGSTHSLSTSNGGVALHGSWDKFDTSLSSQPAVQPTAAAAAAAPLLEPSPTSLPSLPLNNPPEFSDVPPLLVDSRPTAVKQGTTTTVTITITIPPPRVYFLVQCPPRFSFHSNLPQVHRRLLPLAHSRRGMAEVPV